MTLKQQSLSSQVVIEKYGCKSRREQFLDEMEQVAPWSRLQALVLRITRRRQQPAA